MIPAFSISTPTFPRGPALPQTIRIGPGGLRHPRIRGKQGNAFNHGLRHQDPVERVLVEGRQPVDGKGVFAGDGQFAITVVEQPPAQEPRIHSEIVPPEATLDGDFPYAGRTEHRLILGVFEQVASRLRQLFGLPRRPEQQVGVKQ